MTKWLIAVILALLAALGWVRSGAVQARADAERYLALTQAQKVALEAAQSDLKRVQAAATKRAQAEQALRKQLKDSNDALSRALAANPGWAEQPLPPDVAEWLRNN